MFDNPRQRHQFDTAEALTDLSPEIEFAPQERTAAQPDARGFELSGRIWLGMISCYALFLASISAALGSSGKAMLSIAVSIAPAAVAFFGMTTFVIKVPTGNAA